jgi:hypothetical protein
MTLKNELRGKKRKEIKRDSPIIPFLILSFNLLAK